MQGNANRRKMGENGLEIENKRKHDEDQLNLKRYEMNLKFQLQSRGEFNMANGPILLDIFTVSLIEVMGKEITILH